MWGDLPQDCLEQPWQALYCLEVLHSRGAWPAACDAPTIQESDLQNAEVKAIHEVLDDKDAVPPILEMNIIEVLSNDSSSEVSEIDHRLGELQQELLRLANTKNDYTNVADEIYRLWEER